MTVKMIAVDMDGTFLNSSNDYNRSLFAGLYEKMRRSNVRFVVASGNQYYQLKSFFPDIENEISFVAENGAFIVSEGKEIDHARMDYKTVHDILDILKAFDSVHIILCGKESAYVNELEPESFIKHGSKYYYRLKKVTDLYAINHDAILKFALNCPIEQTDEILSRLTDAVGDRVTPVSSGHGDIDLIMPGVHKANGLKKLQALWNIDAKDVAAFGDGGNDIEMLKHAGYSFAVENASENVKRIAGQIVPSNNDGGVLQTIASLLLHYDR